MNSSTNDQSSNFSYPQESNDEMDIEVDQLAKIIDSRTSSINLLVNKLAAMREAGNVSIYLSAISSMVLKYIWS